MRLAQKHQKGEQNKSYVRKLLQTCKTWSGPCTSVDELQIAMTANPDKVEQIVTTELSYYKHTHTADVTARPELFRLRKIDHEERVENLCVLLEDEDRVASDPTAKLPSNSDALNTVNALNNHEPVPAPDVTPLDVGNYCITVWQDGWYVGYILDRQDTKLTVDHMERVKVGVDIVWHYPSISDCQDVEEEQILPYKPTGEWDLTQLRDMKYKLTNITDVRRAMAIFLK